MQSVTHSSASQQQVDFVLNAYFKYFCFPMAACGLLLHIYNASALFLIGIKFILLRNQIYVLYYVTKFAGNSLWHYRIIYMSTPLHANGPPDDTKLINDSLIGLKVHNSKNLVKHLENILFVINYRPIYILCRPQLVVPNILSNFLVNR